MGIILIPDPDFNGQSAIIKKNIKKTIPKLLLDGNSIFLFFISKLHTKKLIYNTK